MRRLVVLLALVGCAGSDPRLEGTSWGTGEQGCCEYLTFAADGRFTREWPAHLAATPQAGAWTAEGHHLTLMPDGLDGYSATWGIESGVLTVLWARPLSYWRRPTP